MKILIVTPGRLPVPATGGGAVENLIQLLLDYNETYLKHEIYVLGVEDKKAQEESDKYQYAKFYFIHRTWLEKYMSDKHLLPYRVLDVIYILKSSSILKRLSEKADRIVIENELVNGMVMQSFIKGTYMYHAHNDTLHKENKKEHSFLQSCDRVITISKFLEQNWAKTANLNNCVTVHNGINLKLFKNKSKKKRLLMRELYGIKPEETVVVYAGRIVPEKGVEALIRAFMELPEEENVKLLIIGSSFFEKSKDNSFVKKIKKVCESRKEQIVFTGYVNYEKMPEFYSMADIGCVPSLWEEPFGLTVIEQMAMELPVITTDAGAISEIVDERCGFIFQRDENLSKNIASAILILKKNDNLRLGMGKIGKNIVYKKFSQKSFCENWFHMVERRNGCETIL